MSTTNISTIAELISALNTLRAEFGGTCAVKVYDEMDEQLLNITSIEYSTDTNSIEICVG